MSEVAGTTWTTEQASDLKFGISFGISLDLRGHETVSPTFLFTVICFAINLLKVIAFGRHAKLTLPN